MRIGTWNIANRPWNEHHRELLRKQKCNVWLLTEINPKVVSRDRTIEGFNCHLSRDVMECNQYWAAILSDQPLVPQDDPHPASAAAVVNGVTYCSSILPWRRGCGTRAFTVGVELEEMQRGAIDSLANLLHGKSPLVWGGDWNQNLVGEWENVGTLAGRTFLRSAVQSLNLQVPTDALLHMNNVSHSIDHIAVPSGWRILAADRFEATHGGQRLSDHDGYVIEVQEN